MLRGIFGSAAGVKLATNELPKSEAGAANVGNGPMAARDDHVHPRVSTGVPGTLNGSGEASITFGRVFDGKPVYTFAYEEAADNQPVIFKVKNFTQDANGKYIGCVVKGYRASILPALSGILLVGPLISALAAFNVFGGSAAGVSFSFIALPPG